MRSTKTIHFDLHSSRSLRPRRRRAMEKVASSPTDLNPRRGRKPGRMIGRLRVLSVKQAHHARNDLLEAISRMTDGSDPDGNTLSLTIRNYAYKLGFHDRFFCEKAMAELRRLSAWANQAVACHAAGLA